MQALPYEIVSIILQQAVDNETEDATKDTVHKMASVCQYWNAVVREDLQSAYWLSVFQSRTKMYTPAYFFEFYAGFDCSAKRCETVLNPCSAFESKANSRPTELESIRYCMHSSYVPWRLVVAAISDTMCRILVDTRNSEKTDQGVKELQCSEPIAPSCRIVAALLVPPCFKYNRDITMSLSLQVRETL